MKFFMLFFKLATFFIFFARPARAWVISADFLHPYFSSNGSFELREYLYTEKIPYKKDIRLCKRVLAPFSSKRINSLDLLPN